jgi:hypothetical protein
MLHFGVGRDPKCVLLRFESVHSSDAHVVKICNYGLGK